MGLQPKFSIITVTYNAASVIGYTLKSVAEQSYRNFEYIVIDGASSDDTVKCVLDSCVVPSFLVSEKDGGLYDAMNKGLAHATGDYVCFLNAGDAFHAPDVLEKMVAAIADESSLPHVLYGETAEVDEQRRFVRMRRLSAPEHLDWKSFKQGMLVCHQAFFARRDIAPQYNLDYRLSGDVDWCIRVMKRSTSLLNVHFTIIDYLQGGLSIKQHRASLKERFNVMCKHYGLFSTVCHHIWFVVRAIIRK